MKDIAQNDDAPDYIDVRYQNIWSSHGIPLQFYVCVASAVLGELDYILRMSVCLQ